jgi:hypothetical protein
MIEHHRVGNQLLKRPRRMHQCNAREQSQGKDFDAEKYSRDRGAELNVQRGDDGTDGNRPDRNRLERHLRREHADVIAEAHCRECHEGKGTRYRQNHVGKSDRRPEHCADAGIDSPGPRKSRTEFSMDQREQR